MSSSFKWSCQHSRMLWCTSRLPQRLPPQLTWRPAQIVGVPPCSSSLTQRCVAPSWHHALRSVVCDVTWHVQTWHRRL